MRDGIYRVRLRSGQVYAVQIAQGRCVELLYAGELEHPPKRRSTKRIADDFGDVHRQAMRRRFEAELRLQEELAEIRAGRR